MMSLAFNDVDDARVDFVEWATLQADITSAPLLRTS